ncbi:uncharacterized protein A1O9_10888 [Exophiala aquamarina CBS 119918]|uniref:NmrA-like domain-containing protein n=1 Tax=Exophiala aquamarina CBS 119918 TaxID=1182545 RepID=A0A072NZD3_9EURO|nr:uncharacterized protein A1O9_10888 [Exophiala aquamarina CBS 119918]KEF52981.1 hypothetical protein A1O9_10888 [Exophiala aquamarina CBS 119918]
MTMMGTSSRNPVIAIAGATGHLGTWLVESFLSKDLFPQPPGLVLLSRRHTPRTKAWETLGAQVRILDEGGDIGELTDALEGADVLINAISSSGMQLSDDLVHALPKTTVKLYFPSEFGVDHTIHNFSIPEWDGKKKHFELTQRVLAGSEVLLCRLFVGLFLHAGIGPWFGLHTSKNVYQGIGSLDRPISYTDLGDVAKVISLLAKEVLDGHKVPQNLRIGGTHSSFRRTAEAMEEAGAGTIELRSVELEGFRNKALGRPYNERDAIVFLRFLMGDGGINYRHKDEGGLGNDNETINPNQKYFKWKTMEQFARETGGQPNAKV